MVKKADRIVTSEGEFIIVDEDSQDVESKKEPSRDLVRTDRERKFLERRRQVRGKLSRGTWGGEAF